MTIAQDTTDNGVFVRPLLMSNLLRFGARFAPEDGSGGGVGGFEDDGRRDEVEDTGPLDESEADDAFLNNLRGADEATDAEQDGGEDDGEPTDTPDDPNAESDEQADESAETQEDDAKTPKAGDDAIVEVKVGDETHRVPVKDLKRLFGQEASLTRRSQEVAAERDAVRQDAERARLVVSKALERAEERAKPYAEMDFLVLAQQLSPEDLKQLRADAQAAFEEVNFLRQEAQQADVTMRRHAEAATRAAAEAALKAINDPASPTHIEGWNDKVYEDLLAFAVSKGFKDAGRVTDPAAVKIMHMAMLYERGRTLVREKVKAAVQQPRKPLRAGGTGGPSKATRDATSAIDRLRRSGSADDAEDAFLARLRSNDD